MMLDVSDAGAKQRAAAIARALRETAERVGARVADDEIGAFIDDLMFGQRKLWACLTEGLITSEETAKALVARTASWLQHRLGLDMADVYAAFEDAITIVSAILSASES
jgi:hypothetical protein